MVTRVAGTAEVLGGTSVAVIHVAGEAAAAVTSKGAVADVAGGGRGAHEAAYDGAVGFTCTSTAIESVELFAGSAGVVLTAGGALKWAGHAGEGVTQDQLCTGTGQALVILVTGQTVLQVADETATKIKGVCVNISVIVASAADVGSRAAEAVGRGSAVEGTGAV